MEKFKRMNAKERRIAVQRIVDHCRKLASDYVASWKPIDPAWDTVEGCAYLRLSTEEQVAVDKGSLEQQVYISIAEAQARSQAHRINYRIVRFFIEPGITGRSDNRPEFQLMNAEIEEGKHRFIIFKEIARIAREVTIWKAFFKLCIEKDTEVFIRGFPLNPNDPTQLLQLDILAAFAEYESNLISKRVRETNSSAMMTSGKFNATHKVLGLDQLVVNDEPKVGFYTPNSDELKTVEWIMRTFIKYASYQRVLVECEKHGVANKAGQPFLRHSLITLLTNKKYIGKWELNVANKEKNQSRLMPYDRYAVIDLPHGTVIEAGLWAEVQSTVQRIAGRKDKNTQIKRVYPLSGLLRDADGSIFHGTGAWGKTARSNYYYNKKHSVRLDAQQVETECKRIVGQLIRESVELQDAIRRRSEQSKGAMDLLAGEVQRVKIKLDGIQAEKVAQNRRLDFLLGHGDTAGAELFKEEYARETSRLRQEEARLVLALQQLESHRAEVANGAFDWSAMGTRAKEILDVIQENDPVALKNALRTLFEAVVVGELEAGGVRKLEFLLKDGKNKNAGSSSVIPEETSSVVLNLG